MFACNVKARNSGGKPVLSRALTYPCSGAPTPTRPRDTPDSITAWISGSSSQVPWLVGNRSGLPVERLLKRVHGGAPAARSRIQPEPRNRLECSEGLSSSCGATHRPPRDTPRASAQPVSHGTAPPCEASVNPAVTRSENRAFSVSCSNDGTAAANRGLPGGAGMRTVHFPPEIRRGCGQASRTSDSGSG